MTDEKPSDVTNKVVWDSGAGHYKKMWRRVNGATEIYPCRVVTETGETYPDISGADSDTTDIPFGVADLKPGHDIDTAYADDEWIPIVPVGSGIGVHVLRIGTACGVALASGDHVGPQAEQGKVGKITTSIEIYSVGTVAYPEAADTTNDTIIKIWLSK